MTDGEGNLVWFGDYYGWDKLKSETKVTWIAHTSPFDCKTIMPTARLGYITTSSVLRA